MLHQLRDLHPMRVHDCLSPECLCDTCLCVREAGQDCDANSETEVTAGDRARVREAFSASVSGVTHALTDTDTVTARKQLNQGMGVCVRASCSRVMACEATLPPMPVADDAATIASSFLSSRSASNCSQCHSRSK